MTVTVSHVQVPADSTIGYGVGTDAEGRTIRFAGDWRPLRDIERALDAGEPVEVELEAWQILRINGEGIVAV